MSSRVPTTFAPQLIKPSEAAQLLHVEVGTVHSWIKKGTIPYIELPSAGAKPSYRIPLQGLLDSLSGTYDLSADLASLYGGQGSVETPEAAS
jgi:excisionase family DNA binding protein